MRRIASLVTDATTIGRGYRKHAAVQSIDAHLSDWEAALGRLERQIARLRALRDERLAQIDAGTWPPRPSSDPDTQP